MHQAPEHNDNAPATTANGAPRTGLILTGGCARAAYQVGDFLEL